MNYLAIIILLLSVQNPDIRLLEINAEWNKRNDVQLSALPSQYKGINIRKDYALLENQSPQLKTSIKAVPVIILMIDGKLKYQWTANLSFKLELNKQDVINVLDKTLKLE